MKITISISRSYVSWTPEEDSSVLFILSPNVLERASRQKEIHASAAENLEKYFSSKGLLVEVIHEDVIAQAKLTYWKNVMINGPKGQSTLDIDDFITEFGVDLRPIQITALKRISQAAFSLNASICGTGKTLTTLLNTFYFHKSGKKTLTIIACPVSCMSEYKKEIQKYRGNFEDLSIEEVYGDSVAEVKNRLLSVTSDIIVVSLNSIDKLVPELQEKMSEFDGEVIFIVEEGHFVKEVSSRRSTGCQLLAPLATRVIVNTATPMPKGPKDIRGILSLVGIPMPVEEYQNGIPKADLETLKGVTFVSDEEDIPYGELKSQHLDYMDLHELQQKMVTVVQDEIQQNKVVIFCSTNVGLQRVWDSFPDVAKTVLSGSFYVNDCEDEHLLPGRSFEQQQEAIKQFNTDERCRLLIVNYRVGSTGINLQHSGARLVFFFEISNNGADFFQARYRVRRPYIFPKDGFVYYFARNKDARKRNTEDKQFAKLASQQAILLDIKRETRGVV